jgi:hypothetical protein
MDRAIEKPQPKEEDPALKDQNEEEALEEINPSLI